MLKQAILLMLLLQACIGNKPQNNLMKITREPFTSIPPAAGKSQQFGLAGAVTGGDGNHLIVAGGSNFEDQLPWKGGTKLYHDQIFILTLLPDSSLRWAQPKQRLPQPMAYSANVQGDKGFFSIGGEDLNGPLKLAFQVFVQGDSLIFSPLPDLPVALSNAGAAKISSRIYVAGGLDQQGASNGLFSLDLSVENPTWQKLANLPKALSHAVVVAQSDGKEVCLYVLGGRNKTGSTSTFFSDIWKYSPSANQWAQAGTLKTKDEPAFGLSAGTGVALGDRWIILLGGDNGGLFNKTETLNDKISKSTDTLEKQRLLKEKDVHLTSHPGFSRQAWAFNTLTGELQSMGEMDQGFPVTTTAFWWNDQVVIPSGEIRPGVRTPEIVRVKMTLP